jgi:hypothetical protein
MRVVALSNDRDSNSAAIRLGIPLRTLAKEQPIELRLLSFHQCTRADLRWGDVFIVQRGINERTFNTMQRLKNMGKPVIYEVDDLLIQLPEFLQDHQTMRMHQDLVMKMMAMADAVSTTTSRLAAQLAALNPSVHLVPNYAVPNGTAMARHDANMAPRATLILAASDTVQTAFLLPALEAIHARYGTSVELVCIGAIAKSIDVAGMSISKHPIVPQARFGELIAALPNPIGLIPLDDSLFSSCKTAIKYLDYAVAGTPSICSNVSPYRDVIMDQQTGLLVENTTGSWCEAISSLIDSPELRQRIVDGAFDQVCKHHQLSHTAHAWHKLLAAVCKDRPSAQRPTRLQSLQDAWCDIGDRFMVYLREVNRARLLRRKGAKSR